MVSYTPNTQSYLFNHMSFFTDYRSDKAPEMCKNKNSIYYYISKNPKFSKFKKIVDHAQMMGFLDSDQANCTLFIPNNDSLKNIPEAYFDFMDDGLAKQIIAASTIPRKLAKDLLTSSPVCYYYTRNPEMRMYVTNINNQMKINECINVLQFDVWLENGIVHIVDNIIVPNQDHFLN